MLSPFQQSLVEVLGRSAQVTRKRFFGDDYTCRPHRPAEPELEEHDGIADIGFVGPQAFRNGIVFLGISPANIDYLTQSEKDKQKDREIYAAKKIFRNNPTADNFDNLMSISLKMFQGWEISKNYPPMDCTKICFFNVIPFRMNKNSADAKNFYKDGFEIHLKPIFDSIKPSGIVAYGVEIERQSPEWMNGYMNNMITLNGARNLSKDERDKQMERAFILCQRILQKQAKQA